jgi:hypothetical protein
MDVAREVAIAASLGAENKGSSMAQNKAASPRQMDVAREVAIAASLGSEKGSMAQNKAASPRHMDVAREVAIAASLGAENTELLVREESLAVLPS